VQAVLLEDAPEPGLPEGGSGPAPSVHATDGSSTDEGARAAARRRRRLAVLGVVAAGIVLRLMQYGVNRALWLDEALLSSNILGRGWADLFGRPLDYAQTAPWGFLAAQKLLTVALGTSEYVLRLLPLLAGIAGLLLMPALARRYVSRPAAPLAIAVVALAPYLVYYSSEVKQYALDACFTTLVLILAWDAGRTASPRRGALLLGLAGTVAVWFSQPVVFVLAGVSLALALDALRRGDRARLAGVVAAGACWGVSFLLSYLAYRGTINDPEYMNAFWRDGFMPLPPETAREWLWLPSRIARVFREPMGVLDDTESPFRYATGAVALAGFAVGGAWMARRRSLRFALLFLPLGLTLLASALGLYPLAGTYMASGRVLIFLVPLLALPMAEGAVAAARRLKGEAGRTAFAVLAAGMLLPGISYAALSVPHVRAEIKPLLEFAAEQRRPGDLMYVYYNARTQFRYHGPRYGWSEGSNAVMGVCGRYREDRYLDDLARLRGRDRVWILFVDGKGAGGYDERKLMLSFLDHIGKRLDDRVAIGASLYLYDLRPGNTRPGAFQAEGRTYPYDLALDCRGPWG